MGWSHFRRKIFDIHTTSPTPLTTELLTRIGSLYKIEDEIHGMPPAVRRRTQLERAAPVIEALRIAPD
uniref:IS66 family transposase n=1 Tax=Sphingomonas sp. TaxID=28214 RepID=UPI00344C915C